LKKLKRSNLQSRFEEIVETLKEDPYKPTDSFEKLVPYSAKRYSRRINTQHRVVYRVDDDENVVDIYSAWSHYE
jgi:Txe/YoeB family toxin of toxin-antitoxin system